MQDENFYIQAFEQSDFSVQSQEVIQKNLDNYLKEKLKVDENNQFPPGLSAIIIRAIINNLDMDLMMSEISERNSVYISDWLSGDSELYLYFPRERVLQSYEGTTGNGQFISDIMKMAGYENLPDCSAPDQISPADFLKGEITCGGPLLREFIEDEIRDRAGGRGSSLIEGFFNSVAPDLDETTSIKVSSSEFFEETRLWELPDLLSRVKMFGMIAIIVTIIALAISVWLSAYPAQAFLKVLLNASVVLVIFSLVSKVAFRIATDFVLWSKISFSPQIYSQEQIDEILSLFKNLFGAMLDKLLLEILVIGFVILAVVIVLYVLFRFVGLITPESDEDDFEMEDDAYEDEQEDDKHKSKTESGHEHEHEHEREDPHEVDGEDFEKRLLEQKPRLAN